MGLSEDLQRLLAEYIRLADSHRGAAERLHNGLGTDRNDAQVRGTLAIAYELAAVRVEREIGRQES